MLLRRAGGDILLCLILSAFLVLLINSLWKDRRVHREEDQDIVFQREPDDFNPLYEMDRDMIYTDEMDHQMAIAYQNDIFKNGLKATVKGDHITSNTFPGKGPTEIDGTEAVGTDEKSFVNNKTNGLESNYDEESIDQNMISEQYQNEAQGKVRPVPCSLDAPIRNVILIKTHRTGCSTLGNVLYRYGDIRNLTFMLPNAKAFQYYWPLRFHISHARTDLLNRGKPNMVVNIGRFSNRQLLPLISNDSFMITILRNPVNHFESVYEYADISKLIGLWNKTHDPFNAFLQAPRNSTIEFVQNSRPVAIELNMLTNGMAFDLGLEQENFSNEEEITEFIENISKRFDLVLIAEYFDESLVLMKRMLCWDFEDIVYVKHKVRNTLFRNNVTEKQKEKIRSWNKADVMLYGHFNKSLWDKIRQQDQGFFDEVQELRAKVAQIKTVCFKDFNESASSKAFEVPLYMRDNVPKELYDICYRLKIREQEYVRILKDKQKELIKQFNLETISRSYYQDVDDSRIYYEFRNRTDFNITRDII